MPKMKTHKGTAKRFKLTGSGKIARGNAFKKKSPKRKRGFAAPSLVDKADIAVIRKNLGV
jgi:large subunit ribosomal protein L35